MSTFVLVNPSSRSGATGRRVAELETLLRKYVGDYQLLATECEGDGERLACLAAEQGATRLVIAGGDGTVSEALSGLLQCGRADSVEIGLLPLGTGRDFARLLGLGTDLEVSVARLSTGQRRQVDAGRIRCQASDGGERVRCFLNIASVGLSAESARWLAKRGKQGRRGPLSYMVSGVVGLARYSMPLVTIRVDDRVVHEGRLSLAAASNGQYFAGGMRVAPDASIDDGLLDVVVVEGMSVGASLLRFPALVRGRHIEDRRVSVHRGAVVRAESAVEVWVEADGEPVGTLPGTIEILPGVVKLCGLP
ncbi:MAG TPA: diacylglycerol kinase family protein [Polyangiaceae bacterium]|nr:diacylglycerol kinase family protein [Polyangiaceae bacterium]